jgi:phosphatidate cytidylyltransferase
VKRVLTAVILIPLVVLALFKAPLWLFTLLVLGVALLAAREYMDIAKATGYKPFEGAIYFFLLCGFGSLINDSVTRSDYSVLAIVVALILISSPLVFLICGLAGKPLSQTLPDAAVSFLVLPYVGMSLAFMVVMRAEGNGALFLLYLMLLVWCGDIAAYYVGRAIGRHKLAPRISPGKTWEGAVASVLGAVIVGLLLFHYINPIASAFRSAHPLQTPAPMFDPLIPDAPHTLAIAPLWIVAAFAVCVNVAAQLGDLVESALKRGAGLKDSGTLLPGHGGVLDRIDALLFALPVGLLFYALGMNKYFELHGIR